MNNKREIEIDIINLLKSKYEKISDEILIPPPVFIEMEGKVLQYDQQQSFIKIQFPLKKKYANPFGKMQGGVIAAAIDNAFGPLSMLSATLNYTRKLEIKYKKQIDVNDKYIIVEAFVNEFKLRRLFLEAKVLDYEGCVMATAKATNWIV